MKLITVQNFVLNYPAQVQREHLMCVSHLCTTHRFSLSNLRIENIKICNKFRIEFVSVTTSWLLKLIRGQAVLTSVIEQVTDNLFKLRVGERFQVMFSVCPLSSTSHLFSIAVSANLPSYFISLMRPLIKAAVFLTIFEDLNFYKSIHKE